MSFAVGPTRALARESQVITVPVRDADFAVVEACALDENPACRQCVEQGSNNVSLMIFSILSEALQKGGITAPLRPVPSPNSERSRLMVADGSADIKSDWAFNIENNENVLKTAPIILAGELEKGLYGHRGVNDILAGIAIEDVKDLRGVSIRNWRLDWQVMEDLAPKSLTSVPTVKQMFALIDLRRADFTLLEFSSEPDMGREIDGIRLVPFAGVKVSLPESQHFMVSRKLPHADEIVDAVNRGIAILREEGFIRRCLVNSGMINQRVEGWRTLNQTMPPFDKANVTDPSN